MFLRQNSQFSLYVEKEIQNINRLTKDAASYSGTRLIRIPRGHAVVFSLSLAGVGIKRETFLFIYLFIYLFVDLKMPRKKKAKEVNLA